MEGLRQGVEIYVKMNDDIPNEAMVALQNISNHLSIVNFVASNIVSNIYDKIMLLEEDNMKLRLFKLLKVLNRETQFLHIKKNIQNKTRADIDEQQKEYFLHQQIKNIREELGDSGESEDKRELKKKAFLKPWPDEVSKLFAKELAKLDNINPQSPDYSVLLNYLQTLVSLPWGVYTKDRLDLKRAQRVLDRNHYGMEKVKERILEYMAVLRLRGDLNPPSSASTVLRASARPRWARALPRPWAENTSASRWAASTTRLRCAATAAPISAPCPDASSRASSRLAPPTPSSSSTRSTR